MFLPHCEGAAPLALMDQSLATPGMVMEPDLALCPFNLSSSANPPCLHAERPAQTPERSALGAPRSAEFALDGEDLGPADRLFLIQLQKQALQYFLDNQVANGLILDRQRNGGPRQEQGLCSTAATGMGLIALALAATPPFQLLSPSSAAIRIRMALETALHRLPHDRGVIPHFVDSATGAVRGVDHYSTIETSWLLAGALWAGSYLRDKEVELLAAELYDRVDWLYWTAPDSPGSSGLLRHGKGPDGRFLAYSWDRINGETAFMYVLAAGAAKEKALSAQSWAALRPFYGTMAGLRFNNADLGLFVFQYGLDLLDLHHWRAPGEVDLLAEAKMATLANHQICRQAAAIFATYRTYWGLSAGDGPGESPDSDTYRCYAPSGPMDGTSHIMATVAAVAHSPRAVLDNVRAAQHDQRWRAYGRYGFSNINVDRSWVGRDIIGIDAGAAVLALDNFLMADRVRAVFDSLPCVRLGMERLGFIPLGSPSANSCHAEERQVLRQAS
jgi:hypothetical protein